MAKLSDKGFKRIMRALMATDGTNAAMAQHSQYTEGVVKVYLSHIYKRLGLKGKLALARWAKEHPDAWEPTTPSFPAESIND